MSSHSAGSSSLVGTDAIPAVEIPGSKPKPVNYKALHYDASNKWRFDYQGRMNKVHPAERAHIAAKTEWHNDQARRIGETDRLLAACALEYQTKALAILEARDLPDKPPKAPVDPWGAYYQAPTKAPADPAKAPKREWKKEYEAFKGAIDRADASTLTRADIQAESEAAKEAETRHSEARRALHKRVFEGEETGVDFCVYKWRRDAVFENERVV